VFVTSTRHPPCSGELKRMRETCQWDQRWKAKVEKEDGLKWKMVKEKWKVVTDIGGEQR
jgi:hypothetical protein